MNSSHTDVSVNTPSLQHPQLPAAMRLGEVQLAVVQLQRALDFYTQVLGLQVRSQGEGRAQLGVDGDVVLELVERPDAQRPGRHARLYHVALLFPSRVELARAAQRIALAGWPIQGASDHGTHEAIYLADPDGNGLELAADRPEDQWPRVDGRIEFAGIAPLDIDGLMALVEGAEPVVQAEPGLGVGHLHLQVGNIDRALAFWRDTVGFDLMFLMPTAGFVAAGGYHHHLAFNTWLGEGVSPQPDGLVGLEQWTIELPTSKDVELLRGRLDAAGERVEVREDDVLLVSDPWNMRMLVRHAGL